jgi:membrane protease YdiL (CAAX protease family)
VTLLPRARGALAAALLLLAAWIAIPARAFADDPPKPTPPTTAPSAPPVTNDGLFSDLANARTAWAFVLLKFLPGVIGLGLLVAALVRRADQKAGLRPPSPPPPATTVPFGLFAALALLVAFYATAVLAQPLLAAVFGLGSGGGPRPLWIGLAAMSIGEIPVAAVVVARRRALQRAGASSPVPATRAWKDGLATFCVATFVTVLVLIVAGVALQLFTDIRPKAQDLVERVRHPVNPAEPWLVLAFGVLVAPLTEECLFRGLLYPAIKALGGRSVGVVLSAFVFAIIHVAKIEDLYTFFPLWALAIVLALQFDRTNSILATTSVHAIHNLTSLVPILVR